MIRAMACLALTFLASATALAAQAVEPSPGDPPVTLRPGDLLKIEVWREEDLSGEFLVQSDGTATLPLLGDIQVSSTPLPELRDELLRLYRRELRNPSISITPLRRVYVLGEVNEPGLHPVDPTVSLAGAIGLAGGPTVLGDPRRVRVLRDGAVLLDRVRSEAALAALDIRSGDQIYVDRRHWLDRNSTAVVTGIATAASALLVLLR